MTGTRGRPPASSRQMLQEAAFELFLETSYAATTVEQIATRAGVSRNTFFNYFEAKSDIFWVDLDESLEDLAATLRDGSEELPAMAAIRESLLAVGRRFGPTRVPWPLTNHAMIGSTNELQAAAISRLAAHARVLGDYLHRRHPALGTLARAASYAVLAAAVAASQEWATAGTGRGELAPYLLSALAPVCDGYQREIDRLVGDTPLRTLGAPPA